MIKLVGEIIMQAINAIFDGTTIKPVEPIPVEGKYEAVIIFTKPIEANESKLQRILTYFGVWDDEDVKSINEDSKRS